MKEQEVQADAQAGMQFMGSNASAPASPLLTGDLNSSSAGEPQRLGGLRAQAVHRAHTCTKVAFCMALAGHPWEGNVGREAEPAGQRGQLRAVRSEGCCVCACLVQHKL